ncbi:methionine-S-sulfoxide reductase [Janthinobacterium agaricidamnosum NBRC 102515 = DSM 9628]|uniref:Peptide methionine sulfoxide reductase MsrA n=2 Tax=Janthinobacterium agaricidamnosum TaxID=55508 RepID=W0V4I7_9BURK|nr:methionine-S-sulfoxide reductase [Janthinobacterium agaricidamnosum NBRC 102515 = DSM 9628]
MLKLAAGAALALSLLWLQMPSADSAEMAVVIAPPAVDLPAGTSHAETAVFAGGCFWGVQGVFQHVRGVSSALSGYAGGSASTAHYESVGAGDTGHAEAVKVTYDPAVISYGRLLQIFFSVAHNPTLLNRQGPDTGTQYRSAIFPANPQQHQVAQAYIAQLDASKAFKAPIVTKIEDGKGFYTAEAYHQDYLTRYPDNPYIAINDLPKVDNLKRVLPQLYRADPVLVARR